MMDFKIISIFGDGGKKKFDLSKTYNPFGASVFPVPKEASHIYLRGGKIAFGYSSVSGDKKTKKGRFVSIISKEITKVCFPDYKFTASGHYYGKPKWYY